MTARLRRYAGCIAGVVGVLLVTGCGTTVSLRGATAGSPSLDRPAVTSTGNPPTGSTLAAPAAGPGYPRSALVGGTMSPAAAGSVLQGSRLTPNAPLRLGFVIPQGNTYTDPTTGTQQVTEDFTKIIPALVRDLNRHGGIAGHTVEEFRAAVPGQETSIDQQTADEEAACRALTEDHKVFAVLAVAAIRFSTDCYVQHHTPVLVRAFLGSLDAQTLAQQAPWVIDDNSPDLDTMARLFAVTLAREHFVSRHIGIAAPDDPRDHHVVNDVLLPALRAVGAQVPNSADVFYGTDDLEHAPAASASAVLHWRTDGVDTVIPFDLGPAWGFLGQAAHQAGFTPRWVLDSSGRPEWVLDGQENVTPPPDERTAVAVGYSPGYDVLDSDYPLRSAERHCLDVVNQALSTTLDHRTYGQGAGPLVACGLIALVTKALTPYAQKPLVARDLATAVHALSTSYVPLDLPRSAFASGKLDGIAVYRTSRYDAACSCMRYDSPWTSVG